MASVNKAIIVGNLGADPETRYMPNGDAVTNFNVATTDKWKDKATGEEREATEWHRITCYRRQAEVAGQYLKKGAPIYLEGRLKTRKWTDNNGVERYTTGIDCDNFQMLGRRDDQGGQQERAPAPRPAAAGNGQRQAPAQRAAGASRQASPPSDFGGFEEDDIPF